MEFNMKPENGTLSFSGSMWQGCKSSKIEKPKHENVRITIHLLDTSVSMYFEYNLVSCDCSWDFLMELETQKVGCSESWVKDAENESGWPHFFHLKKTLY